MLRPKSPIAEVTLMLDIYWIDPFKSYKREFWATARARGFCEVNFNNLQRPRLYRLASQSGSDIISVDLRALVMTDEQFQISSEFRELDFRALITLITVATVHLQQLWDIILCLHTCSVHLSEFKQDS